jgi:hypothetical protein
MNKIYSTLLQEFSRQGNLPNTSAIIVALLVGFISAIVMYLIYDILYERKGQGSGINRAFILIGPAATALFIAIQFSLPLSLGLLGALSFIRFRTPIKDAEETSYLLVIIALSICAATFNYLIALILIVLVIAGILIRRYVLEPISGTRKLGQIMIAGKDIDASSIASTMSGKLNSLALIGVAENREATRLHFGFKVGNVDQIAAIAKQIEGMSGVEKVDILIPQLEY